MVSSGGELENTVYVEYNCAHVHSSVRDPPSQGNLHSNPQNAGVSFGEERPEVSLLALSDINRFPNDTEIHMYMLEQATCHRL